MKKVIGILLMIAGIVVGLYVGVYLLFFNGIVDVIGQIRAETMDTAILAWGIVKVVSSSAVGGLSAFMLFVPGQFMFMTD